MGSVRPPFVFCDEVRTSYKGPSALQDHIQAVHIFAAGLKIREGGIQWNNNIVELVKEGHCASGLHVRRATRLFVAKREESFTRIEPVARRSREGRA